MNRLRLASLLLLCLTFGALSAEAGSVYRRGETVRFEGTVTGVDGRPLSGLTVALALSHQGFNLRDLGFGGGKDKKYDTLRVLATTDATGRYSIEWSWDPYYNVFELLAALPIEHSRSPALEVLERVEITARVEQTNPIVTPLTVQASAFVNWLQGYLAGQASADEARVYREMGRPEQLDVLGEDEEMSWWYFEAGKVYRFESGKLEQVTHFEPVKSDL